MGLAFANLMGIPSGTSLLSYDAQVFPSTGVFDAQARNALLQRQTSRPQGPCTPSASAQRAEHILQIAAALARRIPGVNPVGRYAPYREVEMNWLEGRPESLQAYRGMWVVVEGENVVASAAEYEDARRDAVAAGLRRPFLFFVPEDDRPFMGV